MNWWEEFVMIQRKEVAIIQKRMDDFIDFAYEDIFGTNSYSDNGFDLNYYQLYDVLNGCPIEFGTNFELRDCKHSMLGEFFSSTGVLVKRKSTKSPDADYDLIDAGYAKVFTRNKVVTYIKLIDKHNIVYLSIEEDFAVKVFKLAA